MDPAVVDLELVLVLALLQNEKKILSHKTFFVGLLRLSPHLQVDDDAPVAGGGPLGGGGHGDEPPPVEGPAHADLRGVAAVAAAGGGARPEELEDGRHGAAAGGGGSLEETFEVAFQNGDVNDSKMHQQEQQN